MEIIPINAIFTGSNVLFNNCPFLTNDNDLTSLILQLVCHAVKSKHLNKCYQFSDTRS